jgi:hypothetical protein
VRPFRYWKHSHVYNEFYFPNQLTLPTASFFKNELCPVLFISMLINNIKILKTQGKFLLPAIKIFSYTQPVPGGFENRPLDGVQNELGWWRKSFENGVKFSRFSIPYISANKAYIIKGRDVCAQTSPWREAKSLILKYVFFNGLVRPKTNVNNSTISCGLP